MDKLKNTFYQKTNSFTQFLWVLIVRIVGLAMFISPLYLPIISRFSTSTESIQLNGNDWIFSAVGLMLFAGGKNIGIILNTIGIGLSNLINKLTK